MSDIWVNFAGQQKWCTNECHSEHAGPWHLTVHFSWDGYRSRTATSQFQSIPTQKDGAKLKPGFPFLATLEIKMMASLIVHMPLITWSIYNEDWESVFDCSTVNMVQHKYFFSASNSEKIFFYWYTVNTFFVYDLLVWI